MISTFTFLSISLSDICNNKGIDNLVASGISELSINNNSCITDTANYYLFCSKSTCQNPFEIASQTIQLLIDKGKNIINISDLQYLNSTQIHFLQLSLCDDTRLVYTNAKEAFCYTSTNMTIEINILLFIQIPFLFMVYLYQLFSWKSFALGHKIISYHPVSRHDEFEMESLINNGEDKKTETFNCLKLLFFDPKLMIFNIIAIFVVFPFSLILWYSFSSFSPASCSN